VQKPILGYWDIRGLAQAIRYQLAYQGIDFEDKQYPSTEDPASRQSWLEQKFNLGLDFPNLPYFIDTDGYKLTEHMAIHQYIADKWNPELLGTTPEERAEVEMLAGVILDLKKKTAGPCYSNDDRAAVQEIMLTAIAGFKHPIGERNYLIGDRVCYMDFYLLELLLACDYFTDGQVFAQNPHFQAYVERMWALPNLGNYLNSSSNMS
jgi:glutathione S-transferase